MNFVVVMLVEQRQIGGLGLHLVKSFTDSMEYYRDDRERNRLVLSKKL